MKKILLVLLVLVSFSFAQEWNWQVISWNSGDATSDTLITTGKDTSDWFSIQSGGSFGRDIHMPETLSFLVWGDMGAAADSTKGTFSLQLSNDKTLVYNYGTLVALPVGTADPKVTAVLKTDFPLFKFGRIIITAALESGDSSMFGAQLTKDYSNY